MKTDLPRRIRGGVRGLFLAACCAILWSGLPARGAAFSEPYTIFYGKVLGTASEQPFLIEEGKLVWTIQRSDGSSLTLKTTLYPFHNGQFSYQLQVPHSALALGLEPSDDGIPMPPAPSTHVHAGVTVNGKTAVLLGPAGSVFTTRQLLRTATYRMDLGVGIAALDTDADGIPDWWEDLYGLDSQDATDALLDLSGDGVTALEAYRRGLDPTRDARVPTILTDEMVVYPAGSTALVLDTADLDSEPEQLTYTLLALNLAGRLTLRNAQSDPAQPDLELAVGDTFLHADLLRGRVIYDHDGSLDEPGSFRISVQDENPEHAVDEAEIRLLAYRPAGTVPKALPPLEARRLSLHQYASSGHVIFDASSLPAESVIANPSAGLEAGALSAYLASYGEDRPYVFLGGGEAVEVTGGHRGDVLVAVANGGRLTGGGGANTFVFTSLAEGHVTITDFSPASGDRIALQGIEPRAGTYLDHYVRLVPVVGGYELQVALDGSGSGYTNLTVSLPGLTALEADLYALSGAGHLVAEGLMLEPRFMVQATEPRASQSGPTAGRFTVVREGSLASAVTLNLSLSGTAGNGVDYVQVSPTVHFPVGVGHVDIEILPYVTGYQGPDKVVQVQLGAGVGYRLHEPKSASISIANLAMVVELEVIDGVAMSETGDSAWVRVRRRYVTHQDALIRLAIGGTAVAGVDYDTLPTLVSMAPQQTSVLLEIKPKAGAVGGDSAKSVSVSLLPHEDYLVKSGAGRVRVALIRNFDTLGSWRERLFAHQDGDLATFARSASGYRGLTQLQHYAFGIDPETPDHVGMPRTVKVDGRFYLTFRKPVRVQEDVVYRVRGFRDLNRQQETLEDLELVDAPDGLHDPDRVYYRVPQSETGHFFIAVELEWLP